MRSTVYDAGGFRINLDRQSSTSDFPEMQFHGGEEATCTITHPSPSSPFFDFESHLGQRYYRRRRHGWLDEGPLSEGQLPLWLPEPFMTSVFSEVAPYHGEGKTHAIVA